jgi:hypothetical protein
MIRRPPGRPVDVVETLYSLVPGEAALAPFELSLDLYFARLLGDGFALATAGGYQPFRGRSPRARSPPPTNNAHASSRRSGSSRPTSTPNPHSQTS